jgi:hypothetical protein
MKVIIEMHVMLLYVFLLRQQLAHTAAISMLWTPLVALLASVHVIQACVLLTAMHCAMCC